MSSARRSRPAGLLRRFLAVIDEGDRVPRRLERRLDLRCALREGGKDRVLPDLAEPVRCVSRVGLLAVHDGVPVAAVGVFDGLRDLVRVVPESRAQVESGARRFGQCRLFDAWAKSGGRGAAHQRHRPRASERIAATSGP